MSAKLSIMLNLPQECETSFTAQNRGNKWTERPKYLVFKAKQDLNICWASDSGLSIAH